MARNECGCLICRLEARLLDDLCHGEGLEEYRSWAASSEILVAFPTASELIAHLHRQSEEHGSSADEVIGELIRASASPPLEGIRQSLLLLIFVPTIHRTTTQITATFPLLGRDDTAQHLFGTLLQFLRSEELRSRRSHLAFSVARKMRRSGFRWALRESRLELPNGVGSADRTEPGADESAAGVFLAAFLDNCERRGWLSEEERLLLTRFKLEGVTSAELARESGQSVGAIEQRIHRLLKRLRRIARPSARSTLQQLDLFPQ